MTPVEYESEIHKLLKLGNNFVPDLHDGNESLPVHGHEPKLSVSAVQSTFVDSLGVIRENAGPIKNLLVYPLVFVVAFAFFYSVLNFSSLVAQFQGFFQKEQDQQILGDSLNEYYQWIGNYYYAVGDKKLMDPNNDLDKDGLSNMDEFIMRTNPIMADSDSDGHSDGVEIINNYNPWGAGKFTSQQKDLAEKLDIILINNRISYNASAKSGAISGAETENYDLSKPGRLSIPKLNLSVDLVWSKDPANFEADLTHGVVHYPGTALPGEKGTIYVSGHSSDYIWKKDQMQNIFTKLNYLKPGDDVFIDVYKTDGKVANFRYSVSGNKIYAPDDQTQFIDNSTSKLNLSTCWPIGTSKDRLVVSAVQVGL